MPRHFLMCRPDHFAVDYAINPWMDPEAGSDRDLALRQWEGLKAVYESLGHPVEPDRPDRGPAGHGLRRQRRARRRRQGLRRAVPLPAAGRRGPGLPALVRRARLRDAARPTHVNEGEGDFLLLDDVILAGTGFRTDARRARTRRRSSSAARWSRCSWSTRASTTSTPRCSVLDGRNVAYLPAAFSAGQPARCCAGCSRTRCSPTAPTPRCSASTRSATAATW